MIQAVYDRDENKITIKGHAYSGEPGHDLICASASMLVYTLAAAVESMNRHGHISDSVIEIGGGVKIGVRIMLMPLSLVFIADAAETAGTAPQTRLRIIIKDSIREIILFIFLAPFPVM